MRLLPLLLVLALAPLAGCDTLPESDGDGLGSATEARTSADLDRARRQWAAAGIEDYHFTLRRGCYCGPESTGPFDVTVRNGRVVRATREGEPVESSSPILLTVDALFNLLNDAFERDAHVVRARFEDERGIPVEISIDYEEMMADEEVGYAVLAFQAD